MSDPVGDRTPPWWALRQTAREIPNGMAAEVNKFIELVRTYEYPAASVFMDRRFNHRADVTPEIFAAISNLVAPMLWNRVDVNASLAPSRIVKYLRLVVEVMAPRGAVHVLKRYARHRSQRIRFEVQTLATKLGAASRFVYSLGISGFGDPKEWTVPIKKSTAPKPPPDVPKIATVGALREFLKIPTQKGLGFLLLACPSTEKRPGPYRVHKIPKRDGTERTICAPVPSLKRVQRRILDLIVSPVATHDAAHGFVIGRSITSNALPHVGRAVIVRFDLKNFFPSVIYPRVRGFFASLGYPGIGTVFTADDDSTQVAQVLARLCCFSEDPKTWGGGGLPQGSPASPAIANLVCRKLDARITGLVTKLGGTYTRYADDLTISFADPKAPVGKLKWWVDRICQQEGFQINEDKFRVLRAGHRQIVTGVCVNDVPRAPKEVRRWLRAVNHNCRKHGVASQAERFATQEGREATTFTAHVRGIASYLHMVSPGAPHDVLAETVAATTETTT